MNKILVINNEINNTSFINNNHIIINESGEYEIEYIDCDQLDLTIEIKDDIYVKIFEYSDNKHFINNIRYILNDHSSLLLFKFYYNKIVKEEAIIDLNKENAKIDYHFSNIGTCKEDYHIVINHNASNTISNIYNKNIALENCKMDFTIDSILPKGNTNCILNQETRIIALDNNLSTIKPNMYIEENDSFARHASVIGKFNDEEIFYLMSRGITYRDAIKLLIKGNIFSNLLVNMEQRKKILDIINNYWR